MSFQVLRIETYKKTSLRGLGGETERDGREKAPHKNADIVKSISYKNMFLKNPLRAFTRNGSASWMRCMPSRGSIKKRTSLTG